MNRSARGRFALVAFRAAPLVVAAGMALLLAFVLAFAAYRAWFGLAILLAGVLLQLLVGLVSAAAVSILECGRILGGRALGAPRGRSSAARLLAG